VNRHIAGQKDFPANNGVVIANAINDVPGDDIAPENGEHVILDNTGKRTIDVSGYIIRDAANNILEIGEGYELETGDQLRVYSGPGTNSEEAYYVDGPGILNNGGDSLALWDAKGKLTDTFAN
jgi:glycerophosphoryl diester phosphodiesterase